MMGIQENVRNGEGALWSYNEDGIAGTQGNDESSLFFPGCPALAPPGPGVGVELHTSLPDTPKVPSDLVANVPIPATPATPGQLRFDPKQRAWRVTVPELTPLSPFLGPGCTISESQRTGSADFPEARGIVVWAHNSSRA